MATLSLKKQKKLEQIKLHNEEYERVFNLSKEEKDAREKESIRQAVVETVTHMQRSWNKMLEPVKEKRKRW